MRPAVPMTSIPNPDLQKAAELISGADSLIIAAGAGMGVDSGLPDFRGINGFWRAYPALRDAGLDFTAAANPDLFARDPFLAWGFYGHRLQLYRNTKPHWGFSILLSLAATKRQGAFVFTSNVDGQFQAAAFDSEAMVECHGSIHHLQCTKPCSEAIWPAHDLRPDIDPQTCRWQGALPKCPQCGALARPNILMFGDATWIEHRTALQYQRLATWLQEARNPVVIELGAGRAVLTVRNFTERLASRASAPVIRINPLDPDPSPSGGVGVALGALDALRALEAQIHPL